MESNIEEELNIKIEKTLSQYSKAEMQYERGIANYYKGNYDESLECFRECWAENNLILEVRPSDTPYITSNAPLWIAHILYMQGKKEKLAVHLRRCRQIYNQYEYIIRPDNQFNSIDVETELFSTDIRRLSNNHRDSRAIDKFYSKILDNYNHNNKNKGSLYAHILLGWADNCGLANNKKKEKELLQQAEQFCNSNSNTKWNFPTVIEQFIRNDSIAYAEGHTIIGRYLGQTGYKTKEPDKKETPVSERAPLNRKKGQKLDLSKEKPIYKGEFQVRHTNGDSFKFSEPFSGRYLCIEITSNHSGQEYACIHKIGLYDYLGKPINNKDFKIIYADSEDNIYGNYTANNIISNEYGKWWCSAKGAKLPHYVVIDLGKEYKLSRIDIKKLQRKECFIGDIKEFNLYLKSTPFNF